MDAGTASFAKNPSTRAQLRNQLLSDDTGNINVADDTRPAGPRNAGPAPGFPPGNFGRPPYQQQNYYVPQEQHPMQYEQNQMYGNGPYNTRRTPGPNFAPQDQRASSMTSQSFAGPGKKSLQSNGISNLFRLRQNRSKDSENDNEEETFITDADNSLLTFNDISSMRNNGGHKYGMGAGMDDTSPIIPTLMTKSHDKMNNIEYRKLMAAQKKMNYNTISKQHKQATQGSNNDPRAMSLQHSQNPYVPQQQFYGNQMPPYAHANSITSGAPQIAPYGRANSMMSGPPPQMSSYGRANSMMSGPPPQMSPYGRANSMMSGPSPQARVLNSQLHVPRPANNGPRAMSLNTAAGRRPMPQMHPSSRPQVGAFLPRPQDTPGPSVHDQYAQAPGTTESNYTPQASQRFRTSFNALEETQQDDFGIGEEPASKDYETPASSSSAISSQSFPSYRVRSQTPESQAETRKDTSDIHRGTDLEQQVQRKSTPSTGKLNIIKLSAPQQKELLDRDKNVHSSEMEVGNGGLMDMVSKEGKNTGHKLEESPRFRSLEVKLVPQHADMTAGNRRRSQIQSMATMESAMSNDSPLKKRSQNDLYMLDNATDANAYVTAPELIERDDEESDQNPSQVTITKRVNSTRSISSQGSQSLNTTSERKETGFSRTRNLLRRFSSRSNKGDGPEKHSRQSSTGSLVERAQSSDTERDGPSEGKVWGSRSSNPKRKSFHSLFSNSSGGTNMGERVKSYGSLANIEEKKIEEKSPVAYAQGSRRSSHGYQGDSTLNADDTRRDENAFQPLKGQYLDSSLVQNEDNDDDEFNFDNTVSEPYKPIYASKDELESGPDARDKHKFKTIFISSDQMGLLTEQSTLMKEIDLLSQELAESVAREANLEQEIAGKNSDTDNARMSLSFKDFEIELRKKSSKVVELIQQLNDERLRRYIAEEQVMLQENGAKPSSSDLVYKIHSLTQIVERKDQEIAALTERLAKQSA
ncbi:Epo1p LALA0_S02e05050g [Lachancea lanzarotensis]|uniref:LALA0S02e05050g1_1 n=1 Tax=Lachancea lanzarotensis TaxID=1245769 RepID=A0A0C7MZM4_9SACH|nr:uncharacterized protein LALA0_S02e05050g [Lachancea lanzarotensis]CEP61025.1 LALA0S02e05050g1_1 [Lachancea lanzarotensis]